MEYAVFAFDMVEFRYDSLLDAAEQYVTLCRVADERFRDTIYVCKVLGPGLFERFDMEGFLEGMALLFA